MCTVLFTYLLIVKEGDLLFGGGGVLDLVRLRSLRGERRGGREGVRLRVRVRGGGVGERCRAGGEGVTLTLKTIYFYKFINIL